MWPHFLSRMRKPKKLRARRAPTSTSVAKERGGRRWIKRVIRKPGALRKTVLGRYGKKGFDTKGRIRCDLLDKLSREQGKTGKRAALAKQLRRRAGVPCPVSRKR